MEHIQAPWVGQPDDEGRVIHYCEYCDTEIREGDEYYHIGEHTICTNCIAHYIRLAGEY